MPPHMLPQERNPSHNGHKSGDMILALFYTISGFISKVKSDWSWENDEYNLN
jgi:hypothetical protein